MTTKKDEIPVITSTPLNEQSVNSTPKVETPVVNSQPVQPVKKKSKLGLILGILFFLALIGGGVALFFLVIKPNYLDNKDEDEKKSSSNWQELYIKYLDDVVEEDYSIALIDFDENDIPELIVRNDERSVISLSTVKKGKLQTIEISKPDKVISTIDSLYNADEDDAVWYFYQIDKDDYENDEYFDEIDAINIKELLKESKWSDFEDHSENVDITKIVTLRAAIDFQDVTPDDYKDVLKEIAEEKSKGYALGNTLKSAREYYKENEENFEESKEPEEQEDDEEYDTSHFKEIKGTDIKKESKGKTIVVLIARQSCSYCRMYVPIISNVSDMFDVTVRYIDLEKIIDISHGEITDEDSMNAINNLEGKGDWKNYAKDHFGSTPLTLFINDNEVIYGIAGYVEESTVRQAFKEAGFTQTRS